MRPKRRRMTSLESPMTFGMYQGIALKHVIHDNPQHILWLEARHYVQFSQDIIRATEMRIFQMHGPENPPDLRYVSKTGVVQMFPIDYELKPSFRTMNAHELVKIRGLPYYVNIND